MIELHKLEHFVELARSGSYTRAAEQLRLSQPALSRSIQALERDIGTALFERARGRAVVRTTEAGHALLPRAQDLLSRAYGLENDLVAVSLPRARTQIAFGVAPLLGSVLLADHEDLMRLHDFGDITVSMGTPELLMEQVDAGDVAFAIGVAPAHGTPPRVAAELLGLTSPRIFVREGHPLLDGTAPSLADLGRFTRVSSVKWNQNVALQLEDPGDASAVRASICIDSFDVLADIALHTDAVLFSNFRPLHTGLIELVLAQRLDVRQNEIMLFSRRGWRLRPEEVAVRNWLRDRCAMLLQQGVSGEPLLREPTTLDGEGVAGDE